VRLTALAHGPKRVAAVSAWLAVLWRMGADLSVRPRDLSFPAELILTSARERKF